jgi:hypothetical protein
LITQQSRWFATNVHAVTPAIRRLVTSSCLSFPRAKSS